MNADFFKVLGQISGIGGITAGILLILYKEIIRKNIFPNLEKDYAYSLLKLIAILIWSIAAIGIFGWIFIEYTRNKSAYKQYPIVIKSEVLVTVRWEEVLSKGEIIPNKRVSKEYDSYTFFLFPNRQWLKTSKNSNFIKNIRTEYDYFSKSIGRNNLAIWFFDKKGDIDIARSADYATLFNLDVNSGPYIVFTKPDQPSVKDIIMSYPSVGIKEGKMKNRDIENMMKENFSDKFVINLNDTNPNCASDMLNILTSQIRTEGVDISLLEANKNVCKAKNMIYISVDKISNFGKNIIDKINNINIEVKGVRFNVELINK